LSDRARISRCLPGGSESPSRYSVLASWAMAPRVAQVPKGSLERDSLRTPALAGFSSGACMTSDGHCRSGVMVKILSSACGGERDLLRASRRRRGRRGSLGRVPSARRSKNRAVDAEACRPTGAPYDAWRVSRDRKALFPPRNRHSAPAVGQQVEVACPVRRRTHRRTYRAIDFSLPLMTRHVQKSRSAAPT
jgi:hypothetical protein